MSGREAWEAWAAMADEGWFPWIETTRKWRGDVLTTEWTVGLGHEALDALVFHVDSFDAVSDAMRRLVKLAGGDTEEGRDG